MELHDPHLQLYSLKQNNEKRPQKKKSNKIQDSNSHKKFFVTQNIPPQPALTVGDGVGLNPRLGIPGTIINQPEFFNFGWSVQSRFV